MITKHLNGYVGYGNSDEEAIDSCRIISILKNTYNIRGFEGLENRRNELSPWRPKTTTLHIKKVGYIVFDDGNIILGSNKVPVTESLFEMLYKGFYNNLSMVELCICSMEIQEFLKANEINVPTFSSYEQILPEDVYMFDEDISAHIITDRYSIIFFNNNKVAVKRNAEELYWTCTYDNKSNVKDIIYYISYVRGYEGIDLLMGGGK